MRGTKLNRRDFMHTAAATGLVAISSRTAFGAEANSKLELGLIGCGGRGIWLGNLFQTNSNTKVVAVHDYFRDQADLAGNRLDVPTERRYVGMDGYKQLIDSGVDAVAIVSPPCFHPAQAVAAMEAGKHVWLAKPIAVDVPGCQSIVDAASRVKGKLTTFVDFQTRAMPVYREAVQRVREGAIGDLVCGQVFYHTGRLGLKARPGTETARLRNWVFDKALSGDIIVEQNIHVIDVANWILNATPIEAWGTGGRRVRTDVGDCWDHFLVTYRYPNDVLIDFSSTQFNYGFEDLCDRIFGSEGTVETHYGGQVFIKNKMGGWPGGGTDTIYQEGVINNIHAFTASLESGNYLDNIQESAASNLSAILGRMAAYRQATVTWDEMLAEGEKLDPHFTLPDDGPETPRERPV
ncbi:MAG: hypothetical protein AMXMBFR4_08000 [Candidatus Hydrogenedentota bacterium]